MQTFERRQRRSAWWRRSATIQLAAGQIRVYDNFLDAVFHVGGAGTVRFKSDGGDHLFIVSSEVYTTGANVRYGTSVTTFELVSFRDGKGPD